MTPYIILCIFELIVYRFRLNPKLIVAVICIFSAVRYGIGWDFFSYYYTGKNIGFGDYNRFSAFWRFLFDFATTINSNQFVIAFSAVLTNCIYYLGIDKIFSKNRDSVNLALITYTLYYSFYLSSFSTIRQGLAVAFMPILLYYFINKNYVKSCVVFVLMSAIHTSAMIVPIWLIFITFFKRLSYKIIFVIFIISIILVGVAPRIVSYIFGSTYDLYFEMQNNFGGKILLVNIFLLVIVLFQLRTVNETNNQLLPYYNIYCISAIFGIIMNLLLPNDIISRILKYSDITLTIILFNLIQPNSKYYIHAKAFLLFFLIALFLLYLYTVSGTFGFGYSCYVPYTTIFSIR